MWRSGECNLHWLLASPQTSDHRPGGRGASKEGRALSLPPLTHLQLWGPLVIQKSELWPILLLWSQISLQVTTLHLAARFSSASVIEAFVKAGAKVDAQDGDQETPLHYAARINTSEDVIRVLIECGADVNACDEFKYTPLHEAAMFNCEVVPVLLQQGAKVNILDSSNCSPLHWAALGRYHSETNINAVKALLAAGADPHLGDDPPLDSERVSAEMKTLIRENLSL